jgi:hypothetical protein
MNAFFGLVSVPAVALKSRVRERRFEFVLSGSVATTYRGRSTTRRPGNWPTRYRPPDPPRKISRQEFAWR